MTTAATRPPLIALAGNPNCGNTALFNLLTGSHQKVANYAGVTVERKEGWLGLADGRRVRVLDLPGTYSLEPRTPDEEVNPPCCTASLPARSGPISWSASPTRRTCAAACGSCSPCAGSVCPRSWP